VRADNLYFVSRYKRRGLTREFPPAQPAPRKPRVVLPLEAVERIEDEANLRRISRDRLVTELLATIARDDLFDAIMGTNPGLVKADG